MGDKNNRGRESVFMEVQNHKMNRRSFFKISTMAVLPLFLKVNLFNKNNPFNQIICKNCGAINKDTRIYFFDWLFKNPMDHCFNCGIELKRLSYKVINKSMHEDEIKVKKVNNGHYFAPVYYQIPFPNYNYLLKSNKPDFDISKLRF